MLRLAGNAPHWRDVLERDFAGQAAGPLRNLCAALVLRQFGMHRESKIAAREGLAHVSHEDFRRDDMAILSSDTYLGEWLGNIVMALSKLEQSDLSELLVFATFYDVVDLEGSVRLTECIAQSGARGEERAITAVPRTLDACWEAVFRQRFESVLTRLASDEPLDRTAMRPMARPKPSGSPPAMGPGSTEKRPPASRGRAPRPN